ncbi:hypothetical protein ABZQ24_21455 [Pseudomonas aeruginosa]|uniref:hypothetical protein n=1 Tax=Pseudomonas aeruginosa TaxID=287 RepID=UPI000E311A1E|nr:hypothetical protein [Pseudomonas aeruginosa]EKV4828830.1 hypothetical protein [Pseudomonas aeruginosa]NPY02916.1 hypothetical protein [Pseudomonas aeruginosa]UTN23085.1 hypothetical protein MMZ77_14590 [Pseudomonas aeruginosa]HBP5244405.1 hypothetical protein [Pseudomonas aeruginosa]HCF7757345.1 hypothetical protein [Pseudomonas aeruginosa]
MDFFLALRKPGRAGQMNLSYLYLKKILEEELRDHDCQCQLNPDFTVTISCRVGGPHGALYIVPNSDFLKSSSFNDLSAFILNLREEIRRFGEFEAELQTGTG